MARKNELIWGQHVAKLAPDEPHALYRFYGAGGTLLYIGITNSIPVRLKKHNKDKPWWTGVTNITVEHYPNRAAVLEAERRAIRAEKPLYNEVHNMEGRWHQSEPAVTADASDEDFVPCGRCRASSRNELALELFCDYFDRLPHQFDESRIMAKADLDDDPDNRLIRDEEDEVVLAAAWFLHHVDAAINHRDRAIETLKRFVPPDIWARAVEQAKAVFEGAPTDITVPSGTDMSPFVAWATEVAA